MPWSSRARDGRKVGHGLCAQDVSLAEQIDESVVGEEYIDK